MPITTKDNVITRSSAQEVVSRVAPNYVNEIPSGTIDNDIRSGDVLNKVQRIALCIAARILWAQVNLDSGERRRIIGRVGPIATIERIRASAANQRIVTPHAVERVIAAKADKDIVASGSGSGIASDRVALVGADDILEAAADFVEPGVAGAGQELADIDPARGIERQRDAAARSALVAQRVDTGAAIEHIDAAVSLYKIIAVAASDGIESAAAINLVAAIAAGEHAGEQSCESANVVGIDKVVAAQAVDKGKEAGGARKRDLVVPAVWDVGIEWGPLKATAARGMVRSVQGPL